MNRVNRLALLTVSLLLAAPAALAQDAAAQPSAAEIGKKLSNPVSDVWALFTEFDFAFNKGDLPGGDNKVSYSTLFQPVLPISLTEDYRLITRPTIPILWSAPVPGPNGMGSVDWDAKTGLGDTLLPLLVSPVKPFKFLGGEVLGGFGPTWLFPTSTDDAFGSQKWGLGPTGVLVWKNKKVTVGAFPQYWWGIADRGSHRPKMSKGSFLYFFFYNLPDAWQVGFNPSIAFDAEATSGNKWNVPIGLTVAKTMMFGKMPVKFQLGGEYSVVHQDDYGKRFMIKLNIIPVIKPLISGTLF